MSYKILLIEDDVVNVMYFEAITIRKGWELKWYASPETFLKKAKLSDFDIIFIDWFLPGMNGLELCDIIKSKSNIPLILCTANVLLSDQQKAHANDFLAKPVKRQEFYDMVEKYCNKKSNLK